MKTTSFLALASLAFPSVFALPGTSHASQIRDDPDDIMMFVCTGDSSGDLSELCSSMCFGSFCAGNGQSLTWDKPSASDARARARLAGCRPTPNRCSKAPYGSTYQCDEFPFKSVQDVSGGTRVNRCIPSGQNNRQSQIIKAYYAGDYCKSTAPCTFNTGYENSGEVKYCQEETCDNDGNEYTKGGEYPQRRGILSRDDAVPFIVSNSSSLITWPTHFRTAEGTEVRVPAGARIGQAVSRMVIPDWAAFDEYVQSVADAEANMTEEEYWESQVAPATQRLLELVKVERTTILEELL